MNKEIKLQPLRISSGWKVNWNLFFEQDINENNLIDFETPTMLSIINIQRKREIELCWYPFGDIKGSYHLSVFNLIEKYNLENNKIEIIADKENYFLVLESKNRHEIVDKIEELVFNLEEYKDERIYKSRGVIDKEAETVRKRILENEIDEDLILRVIQNGHSKNQSLLLDKDIPLKYIEELHKKGNNKGIKNKAKQRLKNNKVDFNNINSIKK